MTPQNTGNQGERGARRNPHRKPAEREPHTRADDGARREDQRGEGGGPGGQQGDRRG